jgi:hypothetical protein
MFLMLAATLLASHADLPRPPLEVSAAARSWRDCVVDGLNRRTGLIRARRDVYDLAGAILAECRPQQDAALTARARWVEGLDLGAAETAAALQRNEREVRSMRDSIIMRASRATRDGNPDWD